MYVEADAKMDIYQAQDGTNRRTLNLLMRKLDSSSRHQAPSISVWLTPVPGNFEALSRPQNRETTGVESDANPAAEPLSGVGAS